jgi:hypothetical protein
MAKTTGPFSTLRLLPVPACKLFNAEMELSVEKKHTPLILLPSKPSSEATSLEYKHVVFRKP